MTNLFGNYIEWVKCTDLRRDDDKCSLGHYVIAGVSQDPGTGLLSPNSTGVGHWVVRTAIENGYIYINNPYTNRKQRYSWEYFYGSFQDWIQELVPPSYPEMAPSTKSPFGIPI